MSHRKKTKTGTMVPPAINRRDTLDTKIVEVPANQALVTMFQKQGSPYVRSYTMGQCSILVTRENGFWHLSIAHPTRYPTWLEISHVWYKVIPGAEGIQGALILPKLSEYVNLHSYCMQVHQLPEGV